MRVEQSKTLHSDLVNSTFKECVIESYRKLPKETITTLLNQKQEEDELRQHKQLCKKLGLTTQLRTQMPVDAALLWREVDNKERSRLAKHFQRKYTKETWEDNRLKDIPLESLIEIDFAQKTGLLASVTLHASKKKQDSCVFGQSLDGKVFLIVRWGQDLIPLRQIIQNTRWKLPPFRLGNEVLATWFVFGIMAGIIRLLIFIFGENGYKLGFSGWAAIVILGITIPMGFADSASRAAIGTKEL